MRNFFLIIIFLTKPKLSKSERNSSYSRVKLKGQKSRPHLGNARTRVGYYSKILHHKLCLQVKAENLIKIQRQSSNRLATVMFCEIPCIYYKYSS